MNWLRYCYEMFGYITNINNIWILKRAFFILPVLRTIFIQYWYPFMCVECQATNVMFITSYLFEYNLEVKNLSLCFLLCYLS